MTVTLLTGCPLALCSSLRQNSYYPDQAPKSSERYVTFLWKLYYPSICLALGHTRSSELQLNLIGLLITMTGCDVNILYSSTARSAPEGVRGWQHGWAPLPRSKAGPEGTRGQEWQPAAWFVSAPFPPRCFALFSPRHVTLRHPNTKDQAVLLSGPLSCLPITQHPWSHLPSLLATMPFRAQCFCWLKPFSHQGIQLRVWETIPDGVHGKGARAFGE